MNSTRPIPLRPSLMADMIQTEIMHDQSRPVIPRKFVGNMASHIIVYLSEILA